MDELNTLYNARRTTIEMLRDRGYTVPVEKDCNDLAEFRKRFSDRQCDFDLKEPHIFHVRFLHYHKVRPNNIRDLITSIRDVASDQETANNGNGNDATCQEGLVDENVDPILVIIRNCPNSTLYRIARMYKNVQLFWIQHLIVNITHHHLNPKFERVPESEVEAILKQFRLSSKFQLPIILKDDPISRYYAYTSGTVCRVFRDSATGGEFVSYRCVK